MKSTGFTALPLLALLAIPRAALAREAPPQPPSQPPAALFGVEPMMTGQEKVVELLLAKKWKEGWNLAHAQFLVLAGHVGEYPGLAATGLALEALADAGLGNESTAICRWNVAQNIDLKLLNADLSPFGAPGELLRAHPYKTPQPGATNPPEPLKLTPPEDQEKKDALAPQVQRPTIISHPPPAYTLAARKARLEGNVVLESIIEKDGHISHLRTLQNQPMGLDLSAIEAICDWLFKPATLKGEPVRVYYVLTVNFKLEKSAPPLISRP